MDVLTFIPGVGQLLSFIGSGMNFFFHGMSQLRNVNKMNNAIRLQNANLEVEWNTQRSWDELMKTKKDAPDKFMKDLADREKTSGDRWEEHLKKKHI
jgi:hypothetical protein